MKKLLLFAIAAATSISSFAQRNVSNQPLTEANFVFKNASLPSFKTTGDGDSFIVRRALSTDTPTLYYVPDAAAPFDTGYISGMNAFGDMGFAERFDISGSDSSVKVLGVQAWIAGRATANSTKTIKFEAWAQGPITNVGTKKYLLGKPTTGLASTAPINIKDLRDASGIVDTVLFKWFPTASALVSDSFFVGVTMNYSWTTLAGDTIAVVQTRSGNRHTPTVYLSTNLDTMFNLQNATQFSDGTWNDNFWENTPGIANDYYIWAIYSVSIPNAIHAITKNDLTFVSSYPNPAKDQSTIKINLKNATDVTVDIFDMTGRKLSTASHAGLGSGDHNITVSTANLPSGNYVYMIHTAEGDGMGIQFSVVK